MSLLEFLTDDPPNAGTPIELLDGRPLQPEHVYLRNNFSIPADTTASFEVDVGGTRRTFDADDLAGFRQNSVEMVLECAGNGRVLMNPVPEGTPWSLGGASPALFRGVGLLDLVGEPPPGVTELIFTGADSGIVEPEGVVQYQFSLGREHWHNAMLATHLGGKPLTREHGGPIRLIVPGQYAMKSVKWLRSITASKSSFNGHFVAKYRYFDDTTKDQSTPVSDVQVRSVIAYPAEGATVEGEELRVQGSAWSGAGSVERVELCVDGGEWIPTELDVPRSEFAAASWQFKMTVEPGVHVVSVRAYDAGGNTQPETSRWNRNGYGNNVIHTVRFIAS